MCDHTLQKVKFRLAAQLEATQPPSSKRPIMLHICAHLWRNWRKGLSFPLNSEFLILASVK